jgi:hypothetical protein
MLQAIESQSQSSLTEIAQNKGLRGFENPGGLPFT